MREGTSECVQRSTQSSMRGERTAQLVHAAAGWRADQRQWREARRKNKTLFPKAAFAEGEPRRVRDSSITSSCISDAAWSISVISARRRCEAHTCAEGSRTAVAEIKQQGRCGLSTSAPVARTLLTALVRLAARGLVAPAMSRTTIGRKRFPSSSPKKYADAVARTGCVEFVERSLRTLAVTSARSSCTAEGALTQGDAA